MSQVVAFTPFSMPTFEFYRGPPSLPVTPTPPSLPHSASASLPSESKAVVDESKEVVGESKGEVTCLPTSRKLHLPTALQWFFRASTRPLPEVKTSENVGVDFVRAIVEQKPENLEGVERIAKALAYQNILNAEKSRVGQSASELREIDNQLQLKEDQLLIANEAFLENFDTIMYRWKLEQQRPVAYRSLRALKTTEATAIQLAAQKVLCAFQRVHRAAQKAQSRALMAQNVSHLNRIDDGGDCTHDVDAFAYEDEEEESLALLEEECFIYNCLRFKGSNRELALKDGFSPEEIFLDMFAISREEAAAKCEDKHKKSPFHVKKAYYLSIFNKLEVLSTYYNERDLIELEDVPGEKPCAISAELDSE